MKRTKTIRLIVIVMIFIVAAKYSIGQTTQEEYNYVTQGYKEQEAKGLDMKKGYAFKTLATTTHDDRKVILVGLYRTNPSVLCAIMIEYIKTGSAVEYLCAPMPESTEDVKTLFWKSLYDGSKVDQTLRLQLITFALAQAPFNK